MPVSDLIVESYHAMVRRISSEFANRYNKFVTKDDVAQELWLWFVSHPNKVKEWSQLDLKDGDKLFAKSLRNAALDYCLREKAVKTGYEYEDQFWYNKEFIKLLLPATLSEDWKRVEAMSSEIKASKSPAESGDWMAFSADIKKAYEKLTEQEQNLIFTFYAQDKSGEELHEQLGDERPSARATMMAANRALNKMVKLLGGFPPYKEKDAPDGQPTD